MSAACWQRRRLRKHLDIAFRRLRRDPNGVVTIRVGVVVVSAERYDTLTRGTAAQVEAA